MRRKRIDVHQRECAEQLKQPNGVAAAMALRLFWRRLKFGRFVA